MGRNGRLTLDKMGYSMPVDAPAYQSPPITTETPSDRNSIISRNRRRSRRSTRCRAPLELIEPPRRRTCRSTGIHFTTLRTLPRGDPGGSTPPRRRAADLHPSDIRRYGAADARRPRDSGVFPRRWRRSASAASATMICGTLERRGRPARDDDRPSGAADKRPAFQRADDGTARHSVRGTRHRASGAGPNWSPPTRSTMFAKPGKERGRSPFPDRSALRPGRSLSRFGGHQGDIYGI